MNSKLSFYSETCLEILLVEDNPGDVIIITELIKASGAHFKLTHASNLKETFVICAERDFDAILLDLGLPESRGLETLKKLQVFKIKSPIIVMTGLDDEDTALASLREGVQDYLVKNKLTPEIILRAILYGIERKKIEDLLKKHTHQFSILSLATGSISRCEDITSILRVTCQNIISLIDRVNVITVELYNPDTINVGCHEWLEPWFEKIKDLTGLDFKNPLFYLTGQKEELLALFYDSNLHKVDGGIYDLLGGTVDRRNCAELEKMLGITSIYAFGILKAGVFYGGAVILSPFIISIDDINNIETIISHASLSIHRIVIEKDLRMSELRYKEFNKELERKIIERTHDIESVNIRLHQELTVRIIAEEALKKSESRLKELNATKDKFFNIVAHDLKNPFTSLLGASELLFQNIHQMNNEKIINLAKILNDSAKSGYEILQNLLDWSRSQTGLLKINPERINLKNIIDENILNLEQFSANKEIEMYSEVKENIFIIADRNMIGTILRNLFSNAVKFSYRFGKIIVSAVADQDKVIISVKDSGIGIQKEDIGKIFRIDTKYSATGTENEQGTGLGLKLCKEFVEKQGGKIWVESIENKGSEFKFSIPVEKP